jgi:hypothetical protein
LERSEDWLQNGLHPGTATPFGDENGSQSGVSFFQVVIYDYELIPVHMRNIFHCLAEPALNSNLVLSVTGAEAPFQFGETRRGHEDVNSLDSLLL